MVIMGWITFLITCIAIALLPSRFKGWPAAILVILTASMTSWLAFKVLSGASLEFILPAVLPLGPIPIRIDALSAWFMLIINFSSVIAVLYGIQYMKPYAEQKANLALHWILFLLFYASLLSLCAIQNGLVFLIIWELMSLSSMLLLIFDHGDHITRQAGLNYLIQMHVSMIFLTVGVIGLFGQTGSFDLRSANQLDTTGTLSVLLPFLIGFGYKAGFLPLHSWLPHAHPAAPAHISGMMSGVMIKIGVYGLLRMIFIFQLGPGNQTLWIGWSLLGLASLTGLYGIMQAIVQHNLKRLLAYSSIENIGIIGMGIGLGCIGLGSGNSLLASLGFMSALLHTLNHSLFKSMLFFAAGSIYRAVHSLQLEDLGGLFKKMPQTALLFFMAALSISGLPPFSGFISEFILYSGFFGGLKQSGPIASVMMLLAILSLVLIGGLTIFAFGKAFGVIFLGNPRQSLKHQESQDRWPRLLPMYLPALLIISIGVFPEGVIYMLQSPVKLFVPETLQNADHALIGNVGAASRSGLIFVLLAGLVLLLRRILTAHRQTSYAPTWGCGYSGETLKMQYTGNSFGRMFRRLAEPILAVNRVAVEIEETFPSSQLQYETHPTDSLEKYLIEKPINWIKRFFALFRFMQNGKIQDYLLYGISFILFIGLLSILGII